MRKGLVVDFLIPILILAGFTLLFRVTNYDIEIEKLFYSSGRGWFLRDANPWAFLYHYGNIPGLIMAFLGFLVFIFGFFYHRISRWRKIGLFLSLVMLVGPGLVVNATFKHHWGRPRPRQIQEFGGNQRFLPVWQKGIGGEGKSFPSGHASVAFYLFTPFFFLRRNGKKWGIFFLCLGTSYGLFMGAARMVQGGHFPSDVLWAGGFTYLTALFLSPFFRFDDFAKSHHRAHGR
ncbi:MAG: phosphatase PAP2 family protein [Desulfatiglandaceae bacterium]